LWNPNRTSHIRIYIKLHISMKPLYVTEQICFFELISLFNLLNSLANWYKNNLKQSILNQLYTSQSKIKGINLKDPNVKQEIFEQYFHVSSTSFRCRRF